MRKTIFTLSLVCSYAFVFGQIWTKKADFAGNARDYDAGFAIGHYGFIGCGWNGTSYYNDFYKWNQATNTWSAIATYPGAGYHFSPIACAIEGKGYVGLGWTGSAGAQDLWSYDTTTNTWTARASLPGGGRYDESWFVIGHKLFVIGGSAGGSPYKNDVWMYDAHTNSWTAKNNSPAGKVDGMVAFSIGKNGYIGGGWDGSTLYNTFWEYDTTNDTWTAIAPFPLAGVGSNPRVFVLGRKAYVCTGAGPGVTKTLADGYVYDTTSKTWSAFTNMGANGIERKIAVAFTVGNYGYIGTGMDSTGGYLNDFWQYSDTIFLAVNEISATNSQQIKLYPNPSNGIVNLQYNGLTGIKTELHIIDIMGQEVKCLTLQGHQGEITIDANDLSNGVYLYRIIDSEGGILNGRFIIAK